MMYKKLELMVCCIVASILCIYVYHIFIFVFTFIYIYESGL